MRKERVAVAMSGGVDSSVAAALLVKHGYEVIGMTMCFSIDFPERKKPACCGISGIEDARRVCHKLGIRHYVVNMRKPLQEFVIDNFINEYKLGRTPNPCVRCNQHLKFDILLKKALSLGAKFLATGHYARISRAPVTGRRSPVYFLKKAKDKHKDQSYFLYRLNQRQLRHIIFPLGNYTKQQVRQLARGFGLATAEKPASQEICFLADTDYRKFLKERLDSGHRPGMILDTRGNILGEHKGIAYYTIGQREGLGVAAGYPLYITNIDAKENSIVAGRKDEAEKKEFIVHDAHFVGSSIKKRVALKVRIRYNHREAAAYILKSKGKIKISLKQPQFAVTPGQSAVFYDKETVVGGGIIDRVFS
ncbi:MAG: tRNA 2-thiouridine(34) synthase MnmA [Candidatus Omnitrophota bacterium]